LVSATKQSYFQADNSTGRVRIDTVHINYKFNYIAGRIYAVAVKMYRYSRSSGV
jgi:hypothetical protein